MATITKTITETITIQVSSIVNFDCCAPKCRYLNIKKRKNFARAECIRYNNIPIVHGLRLNECMKEFGVEVDNGKNIV